MAKGNLTIVLARKEISQEVVGTWAADLGQRPKFRDVAVAKAMIWLNKGDQSDMPKALAYARNEGYSVFSYPASDADPLDRAKRDVLRA